MKIRVGFVSNSSSSSFIVRGFLVDKDKINKEDFLNWIYEKYPELKRRPDDEDFWFDTFYDLRNYGFYFTDSEEDGAPKNKYIIGELLQDTGSEGYIEDMVIDCELDEKLTELKSMIPDSEDLKVKVIVGTRMC